eukprot:4232781-Alexandrium_andersonii.AAC.1
MRRAPEASGELGRVPENSREQLPRTPRTPKGAPGGLCEGLGGAPGPCRLHAHGQAHPAPRRAGQALVSSTAW